MNNMSTEGHILCDDKIMYNKCKEAIKKLKLNTSPCSMD